MMNIAAMLNPTATADMLSPPLSPEQNKCSSVSLTHSLSSSSHSDSVHGKPRSRFSDLEDAIICNGVAKGLTWGQISNQLPHRKRATCFNRYRTLQGIRKSRKRPQESRYSSLSSSMISYNVDPRSNSAHISPITTPTVLTPVLSPSSSSSSPSSSSTWTPNSPPCDLFLSSYPNENDSLIRKLSIPSTSSKNTLPPIYYPIPQHHHHFKQQLSRSTTIRLPSLV